MSVLADTVEGLFDELPHREQQTVCDHINTVVGAPVPLLNADMRKPLTELLVDVSVLGTEADRDSVKGWSTAFTDAQPSLSAIEQKATALGKWWAAAIGVGGSLSFIGSWLTWLGSYWATASDGEQIAVILASAGFLVAMALSVAIIVAADLRARSAASVGQYQARALIAEAYLRTACGPLTRPHP